MKYYLSAIFGFTIWGTFALVLKPLSAYSSLDILLHRVIYASLSIILACFIFRRKQVSSSISFIKTMSRKEKRKLAVNVLLSAVVLALNWFLFIYVMNAVSVKSTSLAYLICPIITTFLAHLFLEEKLNKGQWFAVWLSLISCIILAYGHFLDLVYSMIIALSYATYLVLQKNKFQIDRFFILTIQIVVSTILLLPTLLVTDDSVPKTTTFHVLILIIAVGYTIIPLFLNMYALKGLDSSVVGTLLYLTPIISLLLAVLYYNEPINIMQVLGFGMIFLAVVIFNVAYLHKTNAVKSPAVHNL